METGAFRGVAHVLIGCACVFAAASAGSADYPARSVRVIVPFVPGGGTDLLARLIAPRFSELLGQQIVVDNRGGAGSIVGTDLVAKAPADGYTLGLFDTAFAILPAMQDKLPYDSQRDFVFVAIIATSPSLLVARPGLKARTIQEFVALARANPGKIRFASAGVGTSSHLNGEMLRAAAKIEYIHVPFKGAGQAIVDVMGGHTDFTWAVPGSVKPQIQAGTLVPLAINRPSPNLPDVPTFASVGLGAVDPAGFRFVAAPVALPAPILKKLVATLRTVMDTPDLQARLADNDFDLGTFLPHPEARGFVEKQWAKWRVAVKTSGAKVD